MRSSVWIAALLWGVVQSGAHAQSGGGGDTLALPPTPIPYSQLARPRSPPHRIVSRPARSGAASVRTPQPGPSGSPAAQPASVGPSSPSELETFVDGEVRRGLDESHAPGAVVVVVQNGRVVVEKGYGFAGTSPRRSVDPRSTLFRLGSVSKIFTWVEVMKAVRAGRLRLNEAVNEALPVRAWIPNEGFANPVRLEHLVDHSAGFESRDLGRLFARSPDRLASLPEMLARWRPRRVREPGELYTYSNYGAALAGEAAAYTAHVPFEDLVERDLFGPAHMRSTSFREPHPVGDGLPTPLSAELTARLAQGSNWSDRGAVRAPFAWAEGLAPAIAASSTGDDMAIFMEALLAGGVAPDGAQLWDAQTQAMLEAPGQSAASGRRASHALMQETLAQGGAALSQDGAVPGFRAKLFVAPTLGLGVFVASNGEGAGRLTSRLADDIVARFYAGSAHVAAHAADDLGGLEGLYLTTRRAYHGLEGFVDRLTDTSRVRVGEDTIAVTRHGRTQAYDRAEADRFADLDGVVRVTFLRGAGKKASAFSAPADEGVAERVDGLHRPTVLEAAAALATVAAGLSMIGLLYRSRGDAARDTPAQTFSSRTQAFAAMLHLGSLGAFAVFLRHARHPIALTLNWPDVWLVAASWSALGFGLLTLVQIALLRRVWRGSRRLPGWSADRRLRHTITVVIFGVYTFVAAAWGALEPWAV